MEANSKKIVFKSSLKSAWIILLRACQMNAITPEKIVNVRIRRINEKEIFIFWNDLSRYRRYVYFVKTIIESLHIIICRISHSKGCQRFEQSIAQSFRNNLC